MQINLEENYAIIDGNGVSYDLVKIGTKKNKKGEFPVTSLSYHGTVAKALQAYARLTASQEIKGQLTLKEYLKQYNEIVDRIDKLAEGV